MGFKRDEEKQKIKPITISGIRTKDFVAEMIVDYVDPIENPPVFLVHHLKERTSEIRETLSIGGNFYVPFQQTSGYVVSIKFPTSCADYGTEKELFEKIKAFIHTWVQTDEFSENLAAYYVMLSWVYDEFSEVPYLRIVADFQNGKTRFGIETLGAICYKALPTIAVSSLSALFRAMDTIKGTIVLDEADLGEDSDKTNELVQMLNSGYKKGVPVLRSERGKGGGFDMGVYQVFGPKIICSRANMKDNALESRCLPVKVDKLTREDISLIVTADLEREAGELRNQLLQFRFDRLSAGVPPVNLEFAKLDIQPRARQLLMIMSSVISDPDMLESLKEYAYKLDEKQAELSANSVHAEVVVALRDHAAQVIAYDDVIDKKYRISINDAARLVHDLRATDEMLGHKFVRHIGYVLAESELGLEPWRARSGRGVMYTRKKLKELCKKFGVEYPEFPPDALTVEEAAEIPEIKDALNGLLL
jgi:hypothetical protein